MSQSDQEFHFEGAFHYPNHFTQLEHFLKPCGLEIIVLKSNYDGTHYLSTRDPNVDIEVINKKKSPYKFSGGIFGEKKDVIEKITKFSECFKAEKYNHNIRLFDTAKKEEILFLEHENPKPVKAKAEDEEEVDQEAMDAAEADEEENKK